MSDAKRVREDGFLDIQAIGNKVQVIGPGARLDQICGTDDVWHLKIEPKNSEPPLAVSMRRSTSKKTEGGKVRRVVTVELDFDVDAANAYTAGNEKIRKVIVKRQSHLRIGVTAETAVSIEVAPKPAKVEAGKPAAALDKAVTPA